MSESTTNTLNQVVEWDDEFFFQWVRESRFSRYMGGKRNEVFYVDSSDSAGLEHNFSYLPKLVGSGVTANQRLAGNEEALDDYGQRVTAEWLRNGVKLTKREAKMNDLDKRAAARERLMTWSKEKLRDAQIAALLSFNTGTGNGTAYASASEAVKDAHLAANSDRFLFGAALSNNASNDHSAALGQIDSTNDKLTGGRIDLLKRIAKTANPIIEPIRIREDEEWHVLFVGTLLMRDLRADLASTYATAWERHSNGGDNPLFTDGDLVYGGVVVREIPELGVISGVGNGGIDVGPALLCGASSVGIVWKQQSQTIVDNLDDYKFRPGVAVEECRAVEKLMFNGKQNGIVTSYFAAVADA